MIDVREKAARQFSARLTGRGFESWVREGNDTYVVGGQEYMPQDLVVVRALDAAGNPVSTEVKESQYFQGFPALRSQFM